MKTASLTRTMRTKKLAVIRDTNIEDNQSEKAINTGGFDLTNKRIIPVSSGLEEDNEKPVVRKKRLDGRKFYLHRYASKVMRPIYDMFICYENEEFFECLDDDIWLNFSAMHDFTL